MKKTFKEFYLLTKREVELFRKECIFVFDASFLLNLYEYSTGGTKKLLGILKDLKKENRIWVPYQFAYEYQKDRLNVIKRLQKSCKETCKQIDNSIQGKSYLGVDKIILSAKEAVEKKSKFYEGLLKKDKIRDELTKILTGRIGKPFDKDKIKEIYKEGIERYERKIPPGYEDNKKPIHERYGDLLGWEQIIIYAKDCKKSVVFVTDEKKDWWWIAYDKTVLGPHYQLKKEMNDRAGVFFHIQNSDSFVKYVKEYLKQRVSRDIVVEVEGVSKKSYSKEEEESLVSSVVLESQGSIASLESSDIEAVKSEDVGKSESSQEKK